MSFPHSGCFPFSFSLCSPPVDGPSTHALSPQASPAHVNTALSRQPVCASAQTLADVNTREGHCMCESFVLFPSDKLSSLGSAQGFDPSDLSTPWKTVNTLPDPLLCLCVWTFHSPLMRISPNYFSGCSRGTAVYLDLDAGTWLLCW